LATAGPQEEQDNQRADDVTAALDIENGDDADGLAQRTSQNDADESEQRESVP